MIVTLRTASLTHGCGVPPPATPPLPLDVCFLLLLAVLTLELPSKDSEDALTPIIIIIMLSSSTSPPVRDVMPLPPRTTEGDSRAPVLGLPVDVPAPGGGAGAEDEVRGRPVRHLSNLSRHLVRSCLIAAYNTFMSKFEPRGCHRNCWLKDIQSSLPSAVSFPSDKTWSTATSTTDIRAIIRFRSRRVT
jgi:hypothetical protein